MGIIYKITCNVTNLCYVGSTKTTLEKRVQQHVYDIKYEKCTSHQVLKHNDYSYIILEECDDDILLKREGFYQQKFECVNKNISGRTKEEYSKTKKMVEYRKKWREENYEILAKKKKDWYIQNKQKKY